LYNVAFFINDTRIAGLLQFKLFLLLLLL